MAEMKNLLSFMGEEDRDRALARYDDLFLAVGEEKEDALIASFGSAVRQVLALEKELSEAKKIGVTPFLQPMPVPDEFREGGASGTEAAFSGAPAAAAPAEEPPSFVRAAAGALEDDTAADPWETISPMDDGFPLEDLIPPGELPLKTDNTVFPEVEYGIPEEPDPIPEEDLIPADEPVSSDGLSDAAEPDAPDAPPPDDGPAVEDNDPQAGVPDPAQEPAGPEAGETEGMTRFPYAVSAEQIEAVFRDTEPIDLSDPLPEDPGSEASPETAIEPMAPEYEPPVPEPEKPAQVPEPPRTPPSRKKTGPGAGRVIAAILVTFPFIALWVVSFALFVSLGLAVMALGFACCAAGIYLAGYITGGKLGFMPDYMFVGGGALVLFGLTLLFLWTGLWIAVGGLASVIGWTGSVYRSILKKKVPRKGGAQ